ncbi:uncharacterized protein LOC135168338 isoform X2 [Diachasmimorpha longicaudata]|uniref:uncharacterized protein LOC135168338 isoform X2 n=1 Tax=Diachasmimorpha longicaudata TaxID=58733 RepID=UPI0030B88B6B
MSGMSDTKVLTSAIVPSYISNGYYGYVAPIRDFTDCGSGSRAENTSVCGQNYHISNESSLTTTEGLERSVHYQGNYYSTMSMDMETDELGMGMCCQNNHYVIPEMPSGGKVLGGNEGMCFHRPSRKRNSEQWGGTDRGGVGFKRLKAGSGNSRVDHGPTVPGSPQMHNGMSPLFMTPQPLTLTCHSILANDCCTGAAGAPVHTSCMRQCSWRHMAARCIIINASSSLTMVLLRLNSDCLVH